MLPVVSLDHRILREEAFHQVLQTRVPNAKELCLLLSLGPYAEALRSTLQFKMAVAAAGCVQTLLANCPCAAGAPPHRPAQHLNLVRTGRRGCRKALSCFTATSYWGLGAVPGRGLPKADRDAQLLGPPD